jgi:non-specific protein-tyrosine kinase
MDERERTPLPLARLLLRAVPVALICAAGCAVAAGLISNQREPVYEASAIVLTRASSDPVTGSFSYDDEGEGVATDALVVAAPDVLARAAKRSDDLSVEELEKAVTTTAVGGTNAVRVTVTDGRSARVALMANAVADAFVALQLQELSRRARRARDILRQQLDSLSEESQASQQGVQLRERIQSLLVLERLGSPAPKIIEPAERPSSALSPRPWRDALFGGIFGLVLGSGLAALWVTSDRRIRHLGEASDVLGVPPLATFRGGGRLRLAGPRGSDDQAWRLVHFGLRHLHQREPLRTVAVTPVTAGEGRTKVAWGVAATAAAAGERTLFIGLEPEERDLDRQARAVTRHGLAAVVAGRATLPQAVTGVRVTESGNVDVLMEGSRNGRSPALVESPRLGETIREAAEDYDLVVIDTPSLLERAEGVSVVAEADGTVVVLSAHVDRERLVALRERLAAGHARAVGLVVSR